MDGRCNEIVHEYSSLTQRFHDALVNNEGVSYDDADELAGSLLANLVGRTYRETNSNE